MADAPLVCDTSMDEASPETLGFVLAIKFISTDPDCTYTGVLL